MMVRTAPDTCVWNSSLVTPGWLGPNNFADDPQSLEPTSHGLAEAPSYILASSHKVGCCTVRPERRGLIAFGSFLLPVENWRGESEKKKQAHSCSQFTVSRINLCTQIYKLVCLTINQTFDSVYPNSTHCKALSQHEPFLLNMPALPLWKWSKTLSITL